MYERVHMYVCMIRNNNNTNVCLHTTLKSKNVFNKWFRNVTGCNCAKCSVRWGLARRKQFVTTRNAVVTMYAVCFILDASQNILPAGNNSTVRVSIWVLTPVNLSGYFQLGIPLFLYVYLVFWTNWTLHSLNVNGIDLIVNVIKWFIWDSFDALSTSYWTLL